MNTELEKTIMSAGDLPTIPIVATKVMQLIESDRATAAELSKVVSSDPAVAARVLKISNSSFYGRQGKIQNLSSAIVLLGFTTLKSVVVTASLSQVYQPFGLTEKMLWEHSFGAGLASKIIAKSIGGIDQEEAFLAGLFHDIGKVIMNSQDPAKFQMVMERCYNEEIRFNEAEKSFFSFTHEEAGALVIKKWNFPDALTQIVQQHHAFAFSELTDLSVLQMTSVINLADLFCIRLGIGQRYPTEDLSLTSTKAAGFLGLDDEKLEALLEEFSEAYETDKSSLSAA
ncbi:MAG: HDOD domain-containing protein [Geobacteraceae bacterium]|nr:HDOD domain-containing protein [Geobacteraceae bacterium]